LKLKIITTIPNFFLCKEGKMGLNAQVPPPPTPSNPPNPLVRREEGIIGENQQTLSN